jgi:hypothetical protein
MEIEREMVTGCSIQESDSEAEMAQVEPEPEMVAQVELE